MALDSNTLTWICGFTARKESYPEPWRTMTAFGADRKASAVTGPFSGTVIGKTTVRALHGIFDGTAFVSMTDDEDILVELPRDNGDIKMVSYIQREKRIKACIAAQSATPGTEYEFAPMATTSGSGDAVALCLILLQSLETGVRSTLTQTLFGMGESGFTSAKAHDYLTQVSTIAGFLYEGLRGGNVEKGVPPLSVVDLYLNENNELPFLNEEEIRRLSRRVNSALAITKMPYVAVDAVTPRFFRTAGTAAGEAAETPKEGITALRESLSLPIHPLTEEETAMIEQLPDSYVIPDQLVALAQTIKDDWKLPGVDLAPNVILEGESGTGKTAGTKFLSAVFGIPRTKMTMHPMMESANLIGAFYPVFDDIDDWDMSSAEKDTIKAIQQTAIETLRVKGAVPAKDDVLSLLRWGLSEPPVRECIRIKYDIPTEEEIELDPEGAWIRLGHESDPLPAEQEIQSEAKKKFDDVVFRVLAILSEQANQSKSMSYRFIYSELIRAFQNGWLLEIQEAASVLRPGVLSELNSLLEPGGRIELPNGEYVYRHPDTIVVITTNRDYAGNVDINESLRDRCVFGEKMDLPPAEVMAERAMAQTGYTDRAKAVIAAKAVMKVASVAKTRNIRGSVGMRSLIAWMLDLKRGNFSTERFMQRVVYKMTTRDADVSILRKAYEENCEFVTRHTSGSRRS